MFLKVKTLLKHICTSRSGDFLDLSTNPHIFQTHSVEQEDTVEMDPILDNPDDVLTESLEQANDPLHDTTEVATTMEQSNTKEQGANPKTPEKKGLAKYSEDKKQLTKEELKKEKQRTKRFQDRIVKMGKSIIDEPNGDESKDSSVTPSSDSQ